MSESTRVGLPVVQSNHNFIRGQCVRFDGNNWVLATSGVAGVGLVGDALDANRFEFVQLGELEGLDSLTPGITYYPDSNGNLSPVENGSPIGIAYTEKILHVVPIGAGGSTSVGTIDLGLYATVISLQSAIATEVSRANATYELKGISKTLAYTGDFLTSVTDAYGAKIFSYDIDGRLTSIVGTGLYPTKTFAYTGDQLTSITVT